MMDDIKKISGHATMTHTYNLPIPRYGKSDPYFSEIVERVGSLICTTKEYDGLKKELKIKQSFKKQSERDEAIVQINAYVAKIYGLSKVELKHVLKNFHQKVHPEEMEDIKLKVINEFDKLT